MKYLKSYLKYRESLIIDFSIMNISDINESLNILYNKILKSIDAEEIDIFDTFKLPKEDYSNKLDIDGLSNNSEFINGLSSTGMKKSHVEKTDDYQTFTSQPFKFMMIYRIEANELENPNYILIQVYVDSLKKWDDCKLYKVNGEIKRFYDKLSSKTIEITDGDKNYIYTSGNSNEWVLQNSDQESETFKKTFRKEELEKIINDRKSTVEII